MRIYCGIMLPNDRTGSYHGIRYAYIAGLCYGIASQHHNTKIYYGITSWHHTYEKDPGNPGESPAPQGTSGVPMGTPLQPAGTSLGPPGDALGTYTDHTNTYISTNVQRWKLSIAASESFRCNASPHGLPQAILSCILWERSPFGSRHWDYELDLPMCSGHGYPGYVQIHWLTCIEFHWWSLLRSGVRRT